MRHDKVATSTGNLAAGIVVCTYFPRSAESVPLPISKSRSIGKAHEKNTAGSIFLSKTEKWKQFAAPSGKHLGQCFGPPHFPFRKKSRLMYFLCGYSVDFPGINTVTLAVKADPLISCHTDHSFLMVHRPAAGEFPKN